MTVGEVGALPQCILHYESALLPKILVVVVLVLCFVDIQVYTSDAFHGHRGHDLIDFSTTKPLYALLENHLLRFVMYCSAKDVSISKDDGDRRG